jgi:hypothetical protein
MILKLIEFDLDLEVGITDGVLVNCYTTNNLCFAEFEDSDKTILDIGIGHDLI